MPARIKFPELLQIGLPVGASRALDELADARGTSKTALARQAVLGTLAANGVTIVPTNGASAPEPEPANDSRDASTKSTEGAGG